MCFSAKESCVGVLQEFSVFPLTVCDVVPSLQALGLAHAAHLPPLGQIIPTPSSDFGCRSCQAVAIANWGYFSAAVGTAYCENTFPARCKGAWAVGEAESELCCKKDLVSMRVIKELCREEGEKWGVKIPWFYLWPEDDTAAEHTGHQGSVVCWAALAVCVLGEHCQVSHPPAQQLIWPPSKSALGWAFPRAELY